MIIFCLYNSILKRKGSKKEQVVNDNSDERESVPNSTASVEETTTQGQDLNNVVPRIRKRSILRKDSSYEDNLRPILKNTGELESNMDYSWQDSSSKAEARVLSPQPADTQTDEVEKDKKLEPPNTSEEDDSSDEIQAGPFSDVIIDKPTSTTSSLHNLEIDYLIDDEENSEHKISPLDEENLEDEEIRQIFGNSDVGANDTNIALVSGSASSEDLEELGLAPRNSAFSDVIIDPIPRAANMFSGSGSTLNSPVKSSASTSCSRKTSTNLQTRQPVISPSSVKISADGNLANKLQYLTDTAEQTIKMRRLQSSNYMDTSAHSESHKTSQIRNTKQKSSTQFGPSVIDLDAALPPSGAHITSSQNPQSSTKDDSKENQQWSNPSIPPLNKR